MSITTYFCERERYYSSPITTLLVSVRCWRVTSNSNANIYDYSLVYLHALSWRNLIAEDLVVGLRKYKGKALTLRLRQKDKSLLR